MRCLKKNTHKNHRTLFRSVCDSFGQQDARYEGIIESRTVVESFVQQVARYGGIGKSRIEVDSFVHRSV